MILIPRRINYECPIIHLALFCLLSFFLLHMRTFVFYCEYWSEDTGQCQIEPIRKSIHIHITIYTSEIIGRNIRDFIHCIAFDAVFQNNMCLLPYILLSVSQACIEAAALFISSVIILESTSVVDVFKDTVAIMFVLEVDKWMGESLNMHDLGLDSDSFVIDFTNDDSNVDELIVSVVYTALLILRGGVMAWAAYNCIFGSFFVDFEIPI